MMYQPSKQRSRHTKTILQCILIYDVIIYHPADMTSYYSAFSIYRGHFALKNSRNTPHSSPVKAMYRVSFVSAKSNRRNTTVMVVLCALSFYTWSRYIESLEYWDLLHLGIDGWGSGEGGGGISVVTSQEDPHHVIIRRCERLKYVYRRGCFTTVMWLNICLRKISISWLGYWVEW